MDVIKISEGLMQDSNMPSRNLVATREAYELQADVHATTAPQQQTIVPRYFAVGNRCLYRKV
jgi:phospholipase C